MAVQMPSGTSTRLLGVLRHAKAEQDAPTDFERPLAESGHHDAAEVGAWLTAAGFEPDHAVVSAALRAQETWRSVAAGGHWDLDPDVDRNLYAASADSALDLVRLVPDDVHRLLVVGHNPTMAVIAQLLDDGEGDPDLASHMMSDFPTSAVAVFAYEGSWADLAPGSARLVAFHVGRA